MCIAEGLTPPLQETCIAVANLIKNNYLHENGYK